MKDTTAKREKERERYIYIAGRVAGRVRETERERDGVRGRERETEGGREMKIHKKLKTEGHLKS